jgi:hypothetical protein
LSTFFASPAVKIHQIKKYVLFNSRPLASTQPTIVPKGQSRKSINVKLTTTAAKQAKLSFITFSTSKMNRLINFLAILMVSTVIVSYTSPTPEATEQATSLPVVLKP